MIRRIVRIEEEAIKEEQRANAPADKKDDDKIKEEQSSNEKSGKNCIIM